MERTHSRDATSVIALLCLLASLLAPAAGRCQSLPSAAGRPLPRVVPAVTGIPQSGLIADVPFTEQTGTVANDASGNGNACTFATGSSSPSWNGIGIFEGGELVGGSINQYCTFPATLAPQARTVALCAYLPAQVEMATLDGAQHKYQGGGGLSFVSLLGAENRSGLTVSMQTPILGTNRVYYQQSTYEGFGGSPSGTNDQSVGWNCFFYVMGSSADSPATVDHLYRNGIETTNYAVQQESGSYLAATGQWYLGGGGFSTDLQFVGTFEHVLVWNRMLSADEVASAWQDLEAELIGRGAVLDPSVSTTTDSVAVCLGDSQTSGGVGGVYSWCNTASPYTVVTPPPQFTWQTTNNGEQGTTCVSMESGMPAEEALNWSPNAPHSVLMLYCGINDLSVAEETPAQIWQRQLAICQLAKGEGYENVVDLTLPSWVDQDANVEALNALIRSNWKSCFTNVVDMATNPLLGAAGAYSNSTYFQQAQPSHLTQTGQDLVAGYATNVLASTYGNTAGTATKTAAASYSMLASDNYVAATSAGATITLPDCLGYVPGHTRWVTDSSPGAISVVAQNSEGILAGQAGGSQSAVTLAAAAQVPFGVQLVSPTAAGCTWHNAATSLSLVPSLSPVVSGQPETIVVNVATNDGLVANTGAVALQCGNANLGSASVVAGAASFSPGTVGYPPGSYLCKASYSDPTQNYQPSSASVTIALQNEATQTALSSSASSYQVGETVTLVGTVSGTYFTPGSGTVTFRGGNVDLGSEPVNASGVATLTFPANFPPGTWTVTATYSGTDGANASADSKVFVLSAAPANHLAAFKR